MNVPADSYRVCLIGGSGRSGTTILKKIFSRHPRAAEVPENRFSIDPDGLVDFFNGCRIGWTPYAFDLKLRRLRRFLYAVGRQGFTGKLYSYVLQKSKIERWIPVSLVPRYAGVGMEKYCPSFCRFVDELVADLTEFTYAGQWNGSAFLERTEMSFSPEREREELARPLRTFWRKVIAETCSLQNAQYYVEDNTWNILHFGEIQSILPEAKLVHVQRDPRDVVASYTTMRWSPKDPRQAAQWYKAIINRWFHVRERLEPSSFLEIALEDLVRDPRGVLEAICAFWEVEWDDSLLAEDLSRSHSGRWKKDFTKEQVAAVNEVLSPELERLGCC